MSHQIFMQRALELAELGRGSVSPNPMVGCVIVYENQIIGEGWHRKYGEAHAEVNAVNSVTDLSKLSESTVYVTLEPCSHFGKTPPCADLLIKHQVKKVVVCNQDPFELVAGKGIAKLNEAGIEVEIGILAEKGRELNKRFFTYVEKKRPYIILKWAETADGFIGGKNRQRINITNIYSNQLVHQWRSQEDAILVGYLTALHDNPKLNVRLWSGRNPIRVVIDKNLSLPKHLNLFDDSQNTLIISELDDSLTSSQPFSLQEKDIISQNLTSPHSTEDEFMGDPSRVKSINLNKITPSSIIETLYQQKIQSVIIEGGAKTLQKFIDESLFDEMRVFKSSFSIKEGIKAPLIQAYDCILASKQNIFGDELTTYLKP